MMDERTLEHLWNAPIYSDTLNGPSDELNGLSDELNGPSDELNGPSDELNGPSDELNGPSDELNGPSDELNGPSDELNGPSDELNGPSDELEGASGADKEIQTSFAPTEAEDTDKTLTDPNTAAGFPEMVEGSELTFDTKELIWQEILAKYGDITANCSFEGPAVRTKLSEMAKDLTPEIVNLMQENTARSLSDEGFNFISKTLSDFGRMHFNVDWLKCHFCKPTFN
ncbi:hypothetical protein AAG906_017795 [Vitis piasezkii]